MFELAAAYEDVISLTVGEPVFDTPAFIKDAAKQALDENKTHYVSNAGIARLRKRVAEKYTRQLSAPHTEDHVMITFGGMEAILLGLIAVINPGDEVLIPDPGYPNYAGQVRLLGGVPVPVPVYESNQFCIQPQDIEAVIMGPDAARQAAADQERLQDLELLWKLTRATARLRWPPKHGKSAV